MAENISIHSFQYNVNKFRQQTDDDTFTVHVDKQAIEPLIRSHTRQDNVPRLDPKDERMVHYAVNI
jgi:hypothetical protein